MRKNVCRYIAFVGVFSMVMVACRKDDPSIDENIAIGNTSIEPSKPNASPEPEKPVQPEPEHQQPPVVEKPSDYHMAKRMQVRWKVDANVYHQNFDWAKYFVKTPQSPLTIADLSPLVEFSSTEPEKNRPYIFTADDLKQVQLSDPKYNAQTQQITFKASYKSVEREQRVSLPFNLQSYYDNQIRVDTEYLSRWYARGFEKYLGVFFGEALTYDDQIYAVELVPQSSVYNASTQSVQLSLSVTNRATDREIVQLQKHFTGFMPLQSLSQTLKIASSYELDTFFKDRYKKHAERAFTLETLSQGLDNWIKKAQFYIERQGQTHNLTWEEVPVNGGSVFALVPQDARRSALDLYFERPYFTLKSVQWQERNLILKMQLNAVNETSVEAINYTITIHNVKP